MFNRAIDLLYQAKQHEIEVVLNEEQLHLKLPKNRTIDKNLIEEIKVNKQFIIDFLKDNKRGVNNYHQIESFDRKSVIKIPLSFSQERLWFIDQLEGSLQYHVTSGLRLRGRLNVGALEYALQEIVNRHEILRTVYREEGGQVGQYIKPADGWKLKITSGINYIADAKGLQRYILTVINQPFDLSKDHMLRAELIALSAEEHVLVVTMHHIASDAWSMPILVREIAELYSSHAEGRSARLPVPVIQYADYALWQRSYLKGALLQSKLAYWKEKLDGVLPLELPADYSRPLVSSNRGASSALSLSPELQGQLKTLSQRHGATLYMTLLATFKVLLFRYSGQEDICVGTSIAGRPQQELEGLIGFFVNTLALRNEVSGEMPFTALLDGVRKTMLEAYNHQEVPFEKVVETVVKERDASRSPLFQAMLVLRNTPDVPELRLGELALSGEPFEHTTVKFDLTFFVTESPRGLEGTVLYSTDLYKPERIERMIVHFEQLLHSVVKDPDQKVGLLPMLTRAEQHQLLHEFNDIQVTYPVDKTVVDLFEGQVAKTPGAVALSFEGEQLSFHQLNSKANQLAHYLRQQGVKEDTFVPLFIERGLDMMVGMLAILKAGGAYVPIDTDFPANRIHFMLQDTAASILVSSTSSRHKLPADLPAVEIVETDDLQLRLLPATNLSLSLTPANLAYLIYTSGSTGNPKGVMIEHRSLVDYVFGLDQKTNIGLCKSHALVSTIATDLGNTVIYSSLLLGATLHLFAKETVSDAEALQQYFSQHAIDCLKIVPSHWRALSSEALLLPAKLLVFGGEALPLKVVEEIRSAGAACRIVNHYGPTETTIGKLLHVVAEGAIYPATIPIGRPFSNTRVYVLDKYLQLCPPGIGGQLYIAGHGLARGYLNNEALTKAKFVTNPFAAEPSLMYATGDLVKYGSEGYIQFLGRIDDQVKIRGYRVEPGEVERVLQQSEEVSKAVVLARDDKQGNKRLVGYIVPLGYFDRESIVAYLLEKLPDYMVPATLIEIESIPLTANGKIDRKALPDPDTIEAGATHQYIAPRTAAEQQLAAIWEEVLEVEGVGIEDNFFELGGHSLLAVRLISAIRKGLAVEMPISDIFDYPTISLLAERLGLETANTSLLPQIAPVVPRPERIPLSFSQERLWFIDRLEGSVRYHVPAVLRLQGKLNVEALGWAIGEIVNRHEVLRSVIGEEGGQPYQTIREKGGWALEIVDGTKYRENKEDTKSLEPYIKGLISARFDLSKDDMLRATLITLEEEEQVLVVVLHHIASDGWSKSVLVKELVALYNQYSGSGSDHLLPQLPVQYADYAIWQRTYLQGEVLDRKLGYWKEKLGGVEALQLPTDYPRPAVWSSRGAIRSFRIEKTLAEQLQSFSHQQGVTLYMTLLAAFKVLLYRYSGQQDICVGTPIAGRQQAELEDLIGFFVNTLALRTSVSGSSSFVELLQQVKATTLEAYEHQEISFEKVVEAVVQERDMSRNPLFQVMFILRNTPEVPELRLGEVKLSPQGHGHTTALFDLSLFITETENGFHGAIEYSTELYSATTIERLMGHYQELLHSVISNGEEKVGRLGMLSNEEKERLLVSFNATATDYPKEKTIVDLFEEQVASTPEAIAIMFEQQQLTYRELNERANQLAHYLHRKAVATEMLVPICMERGVEMMVGILGILKAGGAYVPIDPDYPEDRIKYMLEDCGSSLVISSGKSRVKLPATGTFKMIAIDGDWDIIKQEATTNLHAGVKPGNLAYIIYTSGSTGRPKGVMVEHGNVVSLVKGVDYVSLTKEDIVLPTGSPSFDATTFEYWSMLLNGGQLVLCTEEALLNIALLKEKIATHKVTTMWFTSSWFNQVTDTDITVFERLKTILVGGEKLSEQHIKKARNQYPVLKMINGYGPTENTTFSITYNIADVTAGTSIPIGRPLSNRSVYILDKEQQLVPVGVAGEICLGGAGLSRGYLNEAGLTAEKFVADPFSTAEGARMYRTGDLGRWLPDGNVEYLGRKDEQVKIRGFRIELGEIESVLQQSGLVNEVVIVARQDKENNKQLAGYVVAEPFNQEAIVSYLKKRLPPYMVPTLWTALDSMPLTGNGKVDRKALYNKSGASLNKEYVAPRNEIERKLVTIWQELLHLDRIGVHDNFFEMGGHSLLVMKMVSYIERELLVSIPVHALFQFATISELGKFLELQTNNSSKEKTAPGFKVVDL